MSTEILIVDDDRAMRKALRLLLEGEGYAVRVAKDGAEGVAAVAEKRPDLVLLDVMMARANGFAACAEIRRREPLLPIVFLSAYATDANRVRGLDLGADAFLGKLDADAVKLATVRRALARADAIAEDAPAVGETLTLGRITVDFARRVVLENGAERERLTATETDILRLLASERGRFFSNDEIYSALRGADYVGDPATIRSHVSHLRIKLGPAGDCISGARVAGYALVR